MVGDLNINSSDYGNTELVKRFSIWFFLPLIQGATKVKRTTTTAIDNTIADSIFESTIQCGIIKANTSDHFPIFIILENSCNKNKNYLKTILTH